jgi:hypothetical protein
MVFDVTVTPVMPKKETKDPGKMAIPEAMRDFVIALA